MMSARMALFGLIWLLRVRGSLCGCAACKRVQSCDASATNPANSAKIVVPDSVTTDDSAPFDVITLEPITRDVTVQTDFEDDDELDRIDLQICEDNTNNELEAVETASAQYGGNSRDVTGSVQYLADKEDFWETLEVTLERGRSGLGLSIAGGADNGSGGVSITRLADDGAAAVDGRLQPGDILLKVNETSVEAVAHSTAVDALQKAGNAVNLKVRRARKPRTVTLWRGTKGLGLGIAGGSDDSAVGGGVFVSHIAAGGAAHQDGNLRLGDRVLAVRNQDGLETSLLGATHEEAVSLLRGAGERVTLVVLPPVVPATTRPTIPFMRRTQATSCSTLHQIMEQESSEIPRCVRMVRLTRTGSRLGMDIVGGLGGDCIDAEPGDTCGVYVSGVATDGAACGLLYQGDRILSVDGRDLSRATHEQAAAALKYSGGSVTIMAQYQPEQYERLRARIRAINASPYSSHLHRPDLHATYSR